MDKLHGFRPVVVSDVSAIGEGTLSCWEPPILDPNQRLTIIEKFLGKTENLVVVDVPSGEYRAEITRVNLDVADGSIKFIPRYKVELIGEHPNFVILSDGGLGAADHFNGNGCILVDASSNEDSAPYAAWIDSILDDLNINGKKVA